MLSVTVDLGWPWWVTTAIALSVAAASTVALVRTRSLLARGVFATLALQGIILAAVAPAVMSDNSSPSAMRGSGEADTSSAPLSKREFARRADENCRRVDARWQKLGNPTTLPGIARQMEDGLSFTHTALAEQGRLTPPKGHERTARQWMFSMKAVVHDLEAVRDAARSGDKPGVDAANQAAAKHAERSAVLSRQLGLKVCFAS